MPQTVSEDQSFSFRITSRQYDDTLSFLPVDWFTDGIKMELIKSGVK